MRRFFRSSTAGASPVHTVETAIRGESFSGEHLAQHARELAQGLVNAPYTSRGRDFSRRFKDNARMLRHAYESVAATVHDGEPITVEAEWLLDNFYVVEEQLREIVDDLPPGFFRELPQTEAEVPRVYRLAIELITHTDSALDEETIVRFVREFQTVAPLSIGEVWAIPIMLRLALVENLRRLATQILETRRCRALAKRHVIDWMDGRTPTLDLNSLEVCAPLLYQLVEQLEAQRPQSTAALQQLEQQLSNSELSPQDVVRFEAQRQAANQVSIGNVITSMRLISALDWVDFFERTNLVEAVLQRDPAGVYAAMDFESRDRYRHAIEEVAKRTKLPDYDVAERLISLAMTARGDAPENTQQSHVGYWLIGKGRTTFDTVLSYSPGIKSYLQRGLKRHPNMTFFGSVGTVTLLSVVAVGWLAYASGSGLWIAGVLALIALLPASELAVNLTNFLITSLLPPSLLPKLEFKTGIPCQHRTVVVVPSMLTSQREVESLLSRLELHYLSNTDPALHFALLTDFADADAKELARDHDLLTLATDGIRALNERYGDEGNKPFLLIHRARRWNSSNQTWMGWERKRGKLMEFNRLLLGQPVESELAIEGDIAALCHPRPVSFVITLDADTQLPHGTARKLIGTLAHPLNRPQYDARHQCNTRGYSILQPRVSVHLDSANRSWFASICSNGRGIDPYITAASDAYQDLFGEGSFTGKGIYDLHAFEQSLCDAFPENQILSHDLIEGCHARVALVSDIEVIDSYPARYDIDMRRQHRWVRGDWQILPWLFPRVPSQDGQRANSLSALSRWKIFDNLRRSLVPTALMLFLVASWMFMPQLARVWTIMGMLVVAFPLIAQSISALRGWSTRESFENQAKAVGADLLRTGLQCVLSAVVLPHKAWVMLDAVIRTLIRMIFTRRDLLEWETAAATEKRLGKDEWSQIRNMAALPIGATLLFFVLPPAARWAASPWLLAWFLAPVAVWWSSQSPTKARAALTDEDRQWLRLVARRTWSFFENWVTEEDHWLPPDNLQEYPSEKLAHRISPTNEGLFLVSALTARDLGYVGGHAVVDLWERNLTQWMRLERLNGHYFNWYDTVTLQPLHPRYVSTVDSGNLMACLLTLRQGLDEFRQAPFLEPTLWQGFRDTEALVEESLASLHPPGASIVQPDLEVLVVKLQKLRELTQKTPGTLVQWYAALRNVKSGIEGFDLNVQDFVRARPAIGTELETKARNLTQWVTEITRDIDTIFPWLSELHGIGGASASATGELPELPWEPPLGDDGQQAWNQIRHELNSSISLHQLHDIDRRLQGPLELLRETLGENNVLLNLLTTGIQKSAQAARELDRRAASLGDRAETLALEMDFRFLYDPQRRLFSIGYNIEEGRLDRSHYDMLCSEARLASYLAISKGDVDVSHWFRLGRLCTQTAGQVSLLSWGGTMFEFLMPALFQRNYEGSLLQQSCHAAVARQQEYGRLHKLPWGISESAFGAIAVNSDYNYRSFGVPGLGLKRGLMRDMVVSPYSTLIALEIDPVGAISNLKRLVAEGAQGGWGYYDALDYSPERLPAGKRRIVVRCYMAHHQGMGLLALGNLLLDGPTRRRFHAHPLGRAAELLLQERVPAIAARVQPHAEETSLAPTIRTDDELVSRRVIGVDSIAPRVHLLSNGHYSTMLTSTGGGYSQCGDIALTRWRSDATRDHWGQFLYLRDLDNQQVWSATHQPTCAPADAYEVLFSIDKAEFHRRDDGLETHLEVAVSPENNAEVRQLTLTNHGEQARTIEVTSYAEIVLNAPAADLVHPAFHKLFVQTEYIAEETALLAMRRQRDTRQAPLWGVHVLASGGDGPRDVEYETSRQAFLGRRRTPQRPAALDRGARLTGQVGAVLDPVFSLRCTVKIPPHQSATVAFTTAFAESREAALALADQYHELRGVQRAFDLAWAYSQVELRHLHLSAAKAHLYQRLASPLLYHDRSLRADADTIAANRQGQTGLWRYGISGDLPIVLLKVTKPEHAHLVSELLVAQTYWSLHRLRVDIVVLNDHPGSYLDALQEQLVTLLAQSPRPLQEKAAGVFLLRGAQIPHEDHVLLEAVASVVLDGDRGAIGVQIERGAATAAANQPRYKLLRKSSPPGLNGRAEKPVPSQVTDWQSKTRELEFWNGLGGFAEDGREYHLLLRDGKSPPMPWSNVIANPHFGCLVTDSGGGYTWSGNSRENKLTTWCNDPISDPPSECLYIRDERSGVCWSPLPGSLSGSGDYWVQHGQGYTRFLYQYEAIQHEVLISIAPLDPIKFVQVTLTNSSNEPRELSLTYYVEWVLGVCREQTQRQLVSSIDEVTGALLTTNAFHPDTPQQTAFLHAIGGMHSSLTADRAEFLGRNGDARHPAALGHDQLSGHIGAGLDPCGAVQTRVMLGAGQKAEVVFLLGAGDDYAHARNLIRRYSQPGEAARAVQATQRQWDDLLRTVQVQTPNRALDLLANRWILYQTLSCRIWGRSAFYQSGGAYGYRDQLQDVMALVYSRPDIVREHLLRAASRQFEEGDVQHWWHPPFGRGTRTRYSDDSLWLPFVLCHYLLVTGDVAILDEQVSFLHSPVLEPQEHERYELPAISPQSATLYEHCRRAIERSFHWGTHGLPLMGGGDWNDGMNRVGELGQGESIWIGWFQLVLIDQFAPVMETRGDHEAAREYRATVVTLRDCLEAHAWDGAWYRRAYFDDGTPLGSAENEECQIDSIAQTWAVMAQADPARTRQAIDSVFERLVLEREQLVLLFTPPFDKGNLDPGYIKGYLPGIRENGGQYSHPVLWLIHALTMQGDADRAMKIFNMLNPVTHCRTQMDIQNYQVEPYAIAADVYGVAPHVGRGGWTWYTGSAAWSYRIVLESILGMQMRGNRIRFQPCVPDTWTEFTVTIRHGKSTWRFTIPRVFDTSIEYELIDDGKLHEVTVGSLPSNGAASSFDAPSHAST